MTPKSSKPKTGRVETRKRKAKGLRTLHSRLRPMIADDKTDGPNTVLVLKGFRDDAEIMEFIDLLFGAGMFYPPKEASQ